MLVSNIGQGVKSRQYFAGVNDDGLPQTFKYGASLWSGDSQQLSTWDYCEKFIK